MPARPHPDQDELLQVSCDWSRQHSSLPSDWSQGRGRDADSGAAPLETGGGLQEEAVEDQGEGASEAEGSGE